MRLFIAIDLDDALKDHIRDVQNKLKSNDAKIKFVEPKNLHMTLKFLGEVPDNSVEDIANKMSKALSNFTQFEISLEGLGYFGSPSYIKVLWIGVNKGMEKLVLLSKSLNKYLDQVNPDDDEPRPHLTLGRVKFVKDRRAFLEKINQLKGVNIGEMGVKAVKLVKSELTPKGPVYSVEKVFELG